MFCSAIDLGKLEYRDLTTNRNGGKMVQVSTVPGSADWNDKIRFQMSEDDQTHLQTAVWPLSTPLQGQDGSRRTFELTVESPALDDFLAALDDKNIDMASDKSEDWFKKKLERPTVEGMYVYMRKVSENGMKPTVKVKVGCGSTRPTNIFVVTNVDAQSGALTYVRGTHDDLVKGIKALVMVETTGLWFMNRTFGMSLNATEILVFPQKRNASGITAFTLSKNIRALRDENTEETRDMEM